MSPVLIPEFFLNPPVNTSTPEPTQDDQVGLLGAVVFVLGAGFLAARALALVAQ